MEDTAMKIAWRYSTVPKVDSSLSCFRRGIPQYDLTKKMDSKKLEACSIFYFPSAARLQGELPSYSNLYKQIQHKLEEDKFSASFSKTGKRVLRIVLEGKYIFCFCMQFFFFCCDDDFY